MSKKVLLASLIATLLTGCLDDGGNGSGNETVKPTPPETPDVTYIGELLASGIPIKGEVTCNGEALELGKFTVKQGLSFSCNLGAVVLGQFIAPEPMTLSDSNLTEAIPTSFDLKNVEGDNAAKVLQTINSCATTEELCLEEINSLDITDIYQHLDDDKAVDAYLLLKGEEATDDVGKAPSSHVDSDIQPEVSEGTSNDLNSDFVSANAENTYGYQPSQAAKVLTKSQLTDVNGTPLVGVAFFSENSTGMTDENGYFEYLWGDTLTFGIDTFEFGSLIGNQVNYELTDVTENAIEKANIQSLLTRYAIASNGNLIINDKVQEVFSLYPNVINELINLSLPNGGVIEGTEFVFPNEFEAQFSQGLTQLIDNELKQISRYASFSTFNALPNIFSEDSTGYVTESLQSIFKNVTQFHVFNDHSSFYGASGYTRGMRALNLSNRAFPIMMPRSDINKELAFGEPQAWTREGKPYIAAYPNVIMPEIPKVSKDNATFGFPFVTAGEIGKGKIVFMGNSLYPSILSCPENYWANDELQIDSENSVCTTNNDLSADARNDNGSMETFFSNIFTWFTSSYSQHQVNVATNIEIAYAARSNWSKGREYSFFFDKAFNFSSVTFLTKGGFDGISADTTPILVLQAYPVKILGDGQTSRVIADLDNPNLTQEDITALIKYVDQGGNILFMDAIDSETNPEPIGRLADTAGISLGGSNVTPTSQGNCGSSYYCHGDSLRPNIHIESQHEMVVLERFPDVNGEPPFTVDSEGNTIWNKEEFMSNLEIPSYEKAIMDEDGSPAIETKIARIFVTNEAEKAAAIAELQAAFVSTPICTESYQYEFNCIETRKGHGLPVRGNYLRADFDRYPVSPDVVTSMVKAANLGDNFNALMEHELYYRTKGKQGTRLSTVELNQTYDNLSIWMWNNNDYAYDPNVQDELGFKTAVGFLNCYTNNQHGMGQRCPSDLKTTLVSNGMLHGEDSKLNGQLNPSYPLNYMEKPLTRIMLGRSFWDQEIKVDTTQYPGHSSGSTLSADTTIDTAGNGVTFSAGNNQSTGLWAPQLSEVSVSGGVKASISIMMADDLTGKPQHEKSLRRPPRMQTSFAYDGTSLTFKVPYGGLIYIKPVEEVVNPSTTTFTFNGVEKAAWWKNGLWKQGLNESTAPIAEVDTGSFIYTTAVKNLESTDLIKFSAGMNRFADAASDFYGRDETTDVGEHRRFTYPELKEYRHRFVNDVQISIGSAHSGYPIMSSSFNSNSSAIPTNAIDDWLLWHETGHNLAAAPFTISGSTEVTNNMLALYMQELEGRNDEPQMDRISIDIQKAPTWLNQNVGHAWSHGDAGMRLVMFGQLKIWAETQFNIDDWYSDTENKPSIYGDDQGWNFIKLMHRKSRGDNQFDIDKNYCTAQDTGLNDADLLMVCSSYVSGYDLSEFFSEWNAGETSSTNPDGTKMYSGGISNKGINMVSQLRLPKAPLNPLSINKLN